MPPASASARRAAGRRRVRGSNMRARFGSTEPGSNGGAPIPPSSRGGGRLSPGHGAAAGPRLRVPSSIEPGVADQSVPGDVSAAGRHPDPAPVGRRPAPARLALRPARPARRTRSQARRSDSGSVARSGSVSASGPAGSSARRGAPVPGTPVRACVGLRTRAGSASSTCRTSCRTSCCRPSRDRTAGRRPRRSWWSRALPCAGRAASPPPVGGAHRTAAGGCPTARSCRRRPAASPFAGCASRMPAGSRRRAPRPPATASADRRIRAVRRVRRRRVARRRPGSRGSAQRSLAAESGWTASRAGDTPA